MAEAGSLLARAKTATKVLILLMFGIFATNASFLRVIAYLQISKFDSVKYAIYTM